MLVNKILLALFILPSIIFSRETVLKGTLNGTVTDAETKTPLIGANIFLLNTKFGCTTDENGKFLIRDVPVGSYSIKFSYVGYETLSKTDLLGNTTQPLRVNKKFNAQKVALYGSYGIKPF